MINTVVFDLGNTLIHYYTREQIPEILERSLQSCIDFLVSRGIHPPEMDTIHRRAQELEETIKGNKVYPMQQRLGYIFGLEEADLLFELCEVYLQPISMVGTLYDDVKPTLTELEDTGYDLAVLSNTPWGCPSRIWKRELDKHDISRYFSTTVCCYDAGWRKPDPRVFNYLLEKMRREPSECIFIGDDPRWDIKGPEAIGMKALLLDRTGTKENSIQTLSEIPNILSQLT